ncbi:MAG: DNA mismatch repair protein MutL [Eubacteriales bacterium SKADARSKE-1]|nr:DNA mismatch repair protein MutL [Eubacteriales bacterium SKADARSKE-1]
MGKINVLDKHIAELIAAGEVVERPSSVIKELIENSIDAGATSVTVEIKNGGTTFMRVTDNGSGIEKSDIKKAFLKNATSKLKNADDLERISTLGFRGEALSSVSAVSKVEVITKTKEETNGTHYEINGGEEALLEDFGCPLGTTVIVRDLFYNVPARMKFLKKDVSEANAIAKLMDRIALSHPEVSFKFIRDNKENLNAPGDGKKDSAIYAVYGKEFMSSLIAMDYALRGLKVSGFISKPAEARPNRNMQHFFINGRYVKTRTAMAAIEEAFKGSIMVQKFPSCVLYIEVPFETVDVNVHPAKVEVRFIDEKPIFELIYHGVKTALLKGDRPVNLKFREEQKPSDAVPLIDDIKPKNFKPMKFAPINKNEEPEIFIPQKCLNYKENIDSFVKKESALPDPKALPLIIEEENLPEFEKFNLKPSPEVIIEECILPQAINTENFSKKAKEKNQVLNEQTKIINNDTKLPFNLIGEVFSTYVVVQTSPDEITFIDKHAAHERLIYEDLKAKRGKDYSQLLLDPIAVTLSKDEYDAVINNLNLFKDVGFEIDDFGLGNVIIRSVPISLDKIDIKNIVIEMAGHILESKKEISSAYSEWLYQNVACRAAIKAGSSISTLEMFSLLNKLEEKKVKHCPHGRPISVVIKKHEIEKQFGRI